MKELIKKIIKYSIGGGISLGLKLVLTFLFAEFVFNNYLISYIITLIIVIITGFLYNFYITFENKGKKTMKFTQYLGSLGFFNIADLSMVFILTSIIGIQYLISITIVAIIIFLAKFFVFNFIFKK